MRRPVFALLAAAAPLLGACAAEPGDGRVGVAREAQTVDQAAGASCSTTVVKGLSEQIVAQANCDAPGAFVAVPAPSNVTYGASVFAYLEQPAKDAFVAAASDHAGTAMTINSMLRTVAQQYLLYHWYQTGQCGIGLAATPGNSNHESGLAFDVEEYTTWKSALEAHGFAWFGSSDPVHYDYAGQGAVDHRGTDVLAFQQLWNKNHPGDTIAEDGQYGPATEARLQQSPAGGFPVGASCGGPPPDGPDVWPAISIDAPDRFTDGSSMGVADLFVGDTHTVTLDVLNKGGSPANPVELGVWIEEPFITATFYEIESDWQHQGQFTINEANDDPKNPPHDAPGQSFTLRIHQLSPNETKRVVLKIKASKYSIGKADSPDVRFWVKDIPNVYHQDQFGHAPTVSKGQTFNGGVLEAFEENDVYSHTEWAWNTDRLEGWTPSGDATLALTGTSALLLGSKGDDPGALGPSTSFSADAFPKFRVRVKRTGGEGAATMYFATSADPELDEAKAVSFAIPDDDAFHAVDVDMTSNAKWTGTVTALRLDPFAKKMGSVELDFLRFEAGGQGGSSAASGGGAGRPTGGLDTGAGGGGAADAGDGTGCSCRVGPAEDHDAPLAASLALVSLALCRRKRRFFARLAFPRWPRRSNSS